MDRPFQQRVAQMLLIKHLIRTGALTRERASAAVQAGRRQGTSLPRLLLEHGWVSAQHLDEALEALRATMAERV